MGKYSKKKQEYRKQWAKKNPDRIKQYSRDYYQKNKEVLLEKSSKWQVAHRGKLTTQTRKMWLKHKYGITEAQYRQMLEDQDHKCAICSRAHMESQYHKLYVDHDHKTKKVRALLCRSCNFMIGLGNESPEILRLAALYLEKHYA